MDHASVFEAIDTERDRLVDLATRLWENPELGLHEHESARTLVEPLADAGFETERGVGGIETAFVASYGEGEPRIGILGEYDALPGLSQAVSAEREPVETGAPGHGCGHNLFGTAGVGAALALKEAIDSGLPGEIRFYGCPAEEILYGKVAMARAGVFDDLDAALTWHPGDLSAPQLGSHTALDSVQFTFEGVSAHAAASPESGRSALDAVSLLNTGVEYMREHVPDDARIHYSITDGGAAPNVVPPTATVWYYVRAPSRDEVDRLSAWLTDITEGAALMTQTEVQKRYVTGCHETLPNAVLAGVLGDVMDAVGPISYTDADREFAADLQATLDPERVETRLESVPDDTLPAARKDEIRSQALYDEPLDAYDAGTVTGGSTDVGDVSHCCPTAQFRAATWPVGTPPHSWQAVAANGDFATEGMIFAAKTLAGAALTLFDDPETLDRAREEFEAETDGETYESPLPAAHEPPTDVTERAGAD